MIIELRQNSMHFLFERHRMYGVDELVESRTSHMGFTHTYIFSRSQNFQSVLPDHHQWQENESFIHDGQAILTKNICMCNPHM